MVLSASALNKNLRLILCQPSAFKKSATPFLMARLPNPLMKRLRRCSSYHYTLHAQCPRCDAAAYSAHPAKYSPHDPYADLRRKEKYG